MRQCFPFGKSFCSFYSAFTTVIILCGTLTSCFRTVINIWNDFSIENVFMSGIYILCPARRHENKYQNRYYGKNLFDVAFIFLNAPFIYIIKCLFEYFFLNFIKVFSIFYLFNQFVLFKNFLYNIENIKYRSIWDNHALKYLRHTTLTTQTKNAEHITKNYYYFIPHNFARSAVHFAIAQREHQG